MNNNDQKPKKDFPPHMATLLSLVYPGAGQALQRRWFAATFYLITFTISLVWFVYSIVKPLYGILKTALDWGAGDFNEPMTAFPVMSIILPLLVSTFLLIANMIDVMLANQRRQMRR